MDSQRQPPTPWAPTGAELLAVDAALAGLDAGGDPLRVVEGLRALLPRELIPFAAELASARCRAAMRHPLGARGFYTSRALEQATPVHVARARARRIAARAGTGLVLDATCGAGGDCLALAAAGLRVVAQERDPLLAACTRANLERAGLAGAVVVADALRSAVRAEWLVLDPDRRAGVGRSLDPDAWSPPLSAALALAARFRGACLKLAPASDPTELERRGARGLAQWVSLDGELRELALWTGLLAGARDELAREALALTSLGGATRLGGPPRERAALAADEARRIAFLADPDPAVVRSGLLGNLAEEQGLAPLAPELAYLGGWEAPSSPLLRAFRVLASCACDPRAVRRLLARHDVGPVEVRKRGHPEPAEALARRFRGTGRRRGRLAVARLARGHAVFLLEPLEPADGRRDARVGDEGIEPPASSL